MSGDPVDPISLETASKLVWEQLAADANLSLRHQLLKSESPQQETEPSAENRFVREELLQRLLTDARIAIEGVVIVGELRAWVPEGSRWKRPTPQVLLSLLGKGNDEPSGLYVDRQELKQAAARWPTQLGSSDSPPTPPTRAAPNTRCRGRPSGTGTYAEDDEPLLKEMGHLIDARKVRSKHAASLMVADRAAGGGSLESRARRLRDAYAEWRCNTAG